MNCKLIYSLQVGKNKNRNGEFCGYRNSAELLDSLLLSASISKKHFNVIEFYCDSEAFELIKSDGRYFPFTNTIVCLDELYWVHEHNWALSKIFVFSLQKEPFVHIDFDVFLWDGIPENILSKKLVFQQRETLNLYPFYNKAYSEAKELNIIPIEITYIPKYALNTAVFGVLDSNLLPILKEYYSIASAYCKINHEHLSKLEHFWHQCVLFEQLFIVNILEKYGLVYGKDYETILNEKGLEKFKNCRYTHLILGSKREQKNVDRIRKQLSYFYQPLSPSN